VHLAADTLAREPGSDLAEALSRPGSATATWVAANVLTAIPEELRQALGLLAELGPVTQTVLDRVAAALGVPCPDAAVPLLARLGVVLGLVGLASVVPGLRDAAMIFGALQIVWLVWMGIAMLRTTERRTEQSIRATAGGQVVGAAVAEI
jgi:hypothetical protein